MEILKHLCRKKNNHFGKYLSELKTCDKGRKEAHRLFLYHSGT